MLTNDFVEDEAQLMTNSLQICFLRSQEADLDIPESVQEPFIEIHRILAALKEQNLRPALKYVAVALSFPA